jgi:hypothetical protein
VNFLRLNAISDKNVYENTVTRLQDRWGAKGAFGVGGNVW